MNTYLQQNGIPFEGMGAQFETRKIFSQIKIESERHREICHQNMVNHYGVEKVDLETHT